MIFDCDAIRCSFSRSRFLDDMDASYRQVATRSNGSKMPPNGPGGGYGRLGVEVYTQEPGYAPEVMNNVMLHGKHQSSGRLQTTTSRWSTIITPSAIRFARSATEWRACQVLFRKLSQRKPQSTLTPSFVFGGQAERHTSTEWYLTSPRTGLRNCGGEGTEEAWCRLEEVDMP
jgi:hypothetical protein